MKTKVVLFVALSLPFSLQADTLKDIRGEWRLSQITVDGKSITCPGQFTLPPGTPAIVTQFSKCGDNETLTFDTKKNIGHYHNNNIGVLGAEASPDGYWFTNKIARVGDYITFVDAAIPGQPSSYTYSISKDRNALTISDVMELFDPTRSGMRTLQSSLIFTRVRTNSSMLP